MRGPVTKVPDRAYETWLMPTWPWAVGPSQRSWLGQVAGPIWPSVTAIGGVNTNIELFEFFWPMNITNIAHFDRLFNQYNRSLRSLDFLLKRRHRSLRPTAYSLLFQLTSLTSIAHIPPLHTLIPAYGLHFADLLLIRSLRSLYWMLNSLLLLVIEQYQQPSVTVWYGRRP